jgi:hypothetical protein
MTEAGQKVREFIRGDKAETLCNLYERWQDEKEYEDFVDYVREFKKIFDYDKCHIKGTKRPFGFRVTSGNTNECYHIFIKAKRNQLEVHAVAKAI